MMHEHLARRLHRHGFERIEQDDRLLDVFPDERRDKGIELWVKWQPHRQDVSLIRLREPYHAPRLTAYCVPAAALTRALINNQQLALKNFQADKAATARWSAAAQ